MDLFVPNLTVLGVCYCICSIASLSLNTGIYQGTSPMPGVLYLGLVSVSLSLVTTKPGIHGFFFTRYLALVPVPVFVLLALV